MPPVSAPGHVEVEEYLAKARMPYTVFQPLYIYGQDTAKDCEQWFIDRIIRWGLQLLPWQRRSASRLLCATSFAIPCQYMYASRKVQGTSFLLPRGVHCMGSACVVS